MSKQGKVRFAVLVKRGKSKSTDRKDFWRGKSTQKVTFTPLKRQPEMTSLRNDPKRTSPRIIQAKLRSNHSREPSLIFYFTHT